MGVRNPMPLFILATPCSRTSMPKVRRRTSLPKSSMSHTPVASGHSIKEVGVISDTHGLVREEALAALQGSQLIIHAGDIGTPAVLERLREIAPVRAVRGNNDRAEWAHDLPETDVVEIGPHHIYLLH